jgi:hypothetical protein
VTSPTARSLEVLRQRGYLADVVERRLAGTFVTKDLFGFIDVLAMQPGQWTIDPDAAVALKEGRFIPQPGLLAVQTTTVANQASRIKKILAEPRARAWLDCGCRIMVHGWALKGARGKRKLWVLTETAITERDWRVAKEVGSPRTELDSE